MIDDVQWLDRASAQTLALVARRLGAESVALLFAIGEAAGQQSSLAGLPELMLGGLGAGEAREMLSAAIPGPLDERLRDRILAETRGNPLALLELPRGVTNAELAGVSAYRTPKGCRTGSRRAFSAGSRRCRPTCVNCC